MYWNCSIGCGKYTFPELNQNIRCIEIRTLSWNLAKVRLLNQNIRLLKCFIFARSIKLLYCETPLKKIKVTVLPKSVALKFNLPTAPPTDVFNLQTRRFFRPQKESTNRLSPLKDLFLWVQIKKIKKKASTFCVAQRCAVLRCNENSKSNWGLKKLNALICQWVWRSGQDERLLARNLRYT